MIQGCRKKHSAQIEKPITIASLPVLRRASRRSKLSAAIAYTHARLQYTAGRNMPRLTRYRSISTQQEEQGVPPVAAHER